ncbi:MAG: DUF6091 family protein [Myxococcota bacterium]|nr:DUF6091 family protein [Myxococcota bacterium]
MTSKRTWTIALALLGLALGAVPASAGVKASLCVYDPSGANGDLFNLMKDYRAAAASWGVDFKLKPYTDEKTAAEDFKAGQCKAALITGTRARPFHKFSATMEAMGALPTYGELKSLVSSLLSVKAARLMKRGEYEIAGIWSGGAVYLFVRDKKIDTSGELAGQRLATLDFDEAAKTMVRQIGASMVAADVGTFGGMFNNGSVMAAYAPATAYKALELYKGIGSKGGIIRYPLAQMTLQLLIRSADFPEGFAQASRDHARKTFRAGLKVVQDAEKQIPSKHWIEIPQADKDRYDEMFLDVRVRLRDKKRVYDKTMLKLMRKVRCKKDGARAECAEKRE